MRKLFDDILYTSMAQISFAIYAFWHSSLIRFNLLGRLPVSGMVVLKNLFHNIT